MLTMDATRPTFLFPVGDLESSQSNPSAPQTNESNSVKVKTDRKLNFKSPSKDPLTLSFKIKGAKPKVTDDKVGIENLEVKLETTEPDKEIKESFIETAVLKCMQDGYQSKKEFVTDYPHTHGSVKVSGVAKKATNVRLSIEEINKQKNTYDSGYHFEAPAGLIGIEVQALCGDRNPEKLRAKKWMNTSDGYSGYKRNAFRYTNYMTDNKL